MTTPPLESEDQARALAPVRDAYAAMAASRSPGVMAAYNQAILLTVLQAEGVELGAYDRRQVEWLAGWEPQQIAAIAGWIERAHAAGKAEKG